MTNLFIHYIIFINSLFQVGHLHENDLRRVTQVSSHNLESTKMLIDDGIDGGFGEKVFN